MKKTLINLSVTSALVMAGALPGSYAEELECDGVLVQSRFALANCMIESAVAIAAAAATENGCQAGEWDLDAVVPEYIGSLIPLQGTTRITRTLETGDVETAELTGTTSALEQNNVNCRVTTNTSNNVFDGEPLTYSSGFSNFYEGAIIDRDSNMLCITTSVSSGDIELGGDDFDELNELIFTYGEVEAEILADGVVVISKSGGGGGQGGGQGQGPGGPSDDEDSLSTWEIEEEVSIPEVGAVAEDGFEFEAETDDIGGCEIEVYASVENLANYIVEGESGGLTISGTMSVEQDEED